MGTTPFEQVTRRCISTFLRLRAQYPELSQASLKFTDPYWLPAFDDSGRFVALMRFSGEDRILAGEDCVRIGNREWR